MRFERLVSIVLTVAALLATGGRMASADGPNWSWSSDPPAGSRLTDGQRVTVTLTWTSTSGNPQPNLGETVTFAGMDLVSTSGSPDSTGQGYVLWEHQGGVGFSDTLTLTVNAARAREQGALFVSAIVLADDPGWFYRSLNDGPRWELPFGVSVTGAHPQPGAVRPSETVTWTISAGPVQPSGALTIESTLPPANLATYVAGSAQPPATVSGGRIAWKLSNVSGQSVSYQVKVADTLPKGRESISTTVTAKASGGKKTATASLSLVKPRQVLGKVLDPVVDFPRRTVVLLRPAALPKGSGGAVRARLLRKSDGSEVDAADVDAKGGFSLQATDAGDYTVRIEAPVERYDRASNAVATGGATIVQWRDVTVADAPVEVPSILLPLSLANDLARRLHRLGNLSPKLAGFLPLPMSIDTGNIPGAIDALVADTNQKFDEVYAGTGPRDGWNAAIRLDAVLALTEARFLDEAKLADIFSKSVSLVVTIEVMKRLGPQIVDRWKAQHGNPEFVPADMRSRTIEAVKIATLAYGVGYLLPKLLNETKLEPQQKALVIETVAKAVRFGLNTFVAAQNDQDVVFEAIFQLMRAAIFAGFNAVFADQAAPQLARAEGMFRARAYAEDTQATLAWLEKYDAGVGDRSTENFRIAGDALTKLSLFVRGLDGVFFKSQQAMGYSANPTIKGTLRGAVQKTLTFLERPKQAATMTAFSLAIGAPLMEQAYVFQDLEVEVNAAFSGPSGLGPPKPPGEGLASFLGHSLSTQGVFRAVDTMFGTRYAAPEKAGPGPIVPPLPEVKAFEDALDPVESALAQGDAAAFDAARPAMIAAHDAFFARLRPVSERAVFVLNDDPSAPDILVGLQGARYEVGSALSLFYEHLVVWMAEPGRANAQSALADLRALRGELGTVSGAVAGAEAVLAARSLPAILVVTGGPDGETVAAGSPLTLIFTVTNIGGAQSAAATAHLETTDALALAGSADGTVPALAPGNSAVVTFGVTTAGARRAGSYVLLVQPPDSRYVAQQGYVSIEP